MLPGRHDISVTADETCDRPRRQASAQRRLRSIALHQGVMDAAFEYALDCLGVGCRLDQSGVMHLDTIRKDQHMTLARVGAALLTVGILMTPRAVTARTFGYLGEIGPAFWGGLDPAWTACGSGAIQSPVDFTKLSPHTPRWRQIALDYNPQVNGRDLQQWPHDRD